MTWKNIIYRCYSKTNYSYKWYGGSGVTVDDRWHCFDNFREDIKAIKGYSEKAFYENEIELDKDGLSKGNKIYSRETCQWVSREENMSLSKRSKYLPHLTQVRLVALSPRDEVFCIVNVPMFADEYGLLRSGIHGTLVEGGAKSHRGWCFKRVTDYDVVTEIDRKDFLQERHGVIPLRYEVLKDGNVIETLDDVNEAAKYMKCSVSNINQRTRDGREYHKYGVILRRKSKETINK